MTMADVRTPSIEVDVRDLEGRAGVI